MEEIVHEIEALEPVIIQIVQNVEALEPVIKKCPFFKCLSCFLNKD